MTLKGFMRGVIDDGQVRWLSWKHYNFSGTTCGLGVAYPFAWFGLICRPSHMKGDDMFCISGEYYRRVK
jgi:hypothetical protein